MHANATSRRRLSAVACRPRPLAGSSVGTPGRVGPVHREPSFRSVGGPLSFDRSRATPPLRPLARASHTTPARELAPMAPTGRRRPTTMVLSEGGTR